MIVTVVGGVIFTLFRYTNEISRARDEVQFLNSTLEQRVNDRTTALVRARDRAEACFRKLIIVSPIVWLLLLRWCGCNRNALAIVPQKKHSM